MGGYSELIKNFSKTRDYVRDFFINGYKTRNDFSRKSSRTYDDEKRRVESWLGDFLRYDDSVKGRQIAISVNSGHISENPLYKAWYSCSFTDNDIRLHFFIIDILHDGLSMTLREIVDALQEYSCEQYEFSFDEQTVRNKLKEYAAEGIILTEKRGKTAYFRLSPDTAENFSNDFPGFDDAVKFFSCSQVFGVIGDSILKSMGLENDVFLMKHNYIVHTLEDEIVMKLLECIHNKKLVRITSFSSADELREKTVVPMQIVSSLQTGRRYIVVYDRKPGKFNALRLDHIKNAAPDAICEEYDELREEYNRSAARSFGVSFNSRSENVRPLRITFTADEQSEKYIIERLDREKRCGVLEKIGENQFSLTYDVYDPNEIMQWIKSFIGRITSIEGGTHHVIKQFHEDIKRMYDMYGGDENGDIQ